MIVIIGIVSLLALHTTVAIQHPDFYKAANEKTVTFNVGDGTFTIEFDKPAVNIG